ncbi:ABC-three component system middle component 8 [Pseudozobellia sp. WGM2]|uniref:ABC-three component system middle component 8 n=1 Tax=Pseudozobellia sp. WGM2 TaxID=2787625 RepID=UPI00352CA0A4
MLTPTKHTNIRYSVLFIAGKLLKYLHFERLLTYDDLKDSLINDLGSKSKYNFDFALTFLYSIGRVQYIKDIDAIELVTTENED